MATDSELIAELADALTMALPYVEDATADPAYKKGVVAKRVADLRKTIDKAEARLNERRFRVVFITDKGERGVHFPGPLTHAEACTCKAALTPYPWRTDALEEIQPLTPTRNEV